MSACTPGPWHSSFKTRKTKNIGVYSKNGALIASLDVHQLATNEVVARRLGDARLMAASHDLLAAATDALEFIEAPLSKLWPAGTIERITTSLRAAIAKANGSAS